MTSNARFGRRHSTRAPRLATAILTLALLPSASSQGQVSPATRPDIEPAWRKVFVGCAPQLAWGEPPTPFRVIGSQEGSVKELLAPGDAIVVDGGSDHGIDIGQEYFIRRVRAPFRELRVGNESPLVRLSVGWIRIVEVDRRTSVATVSHACDGILPGDYLEPFDAPELPEPAPLRDMTDYDNPAEILFGQEGGSTGGTRQFMVISRGAAQGVTPGQRFTVFREPYGPSGPIVEIADAMAVDVAADASAILLLDARGPVYVGDLVAAER